jgi:WD40 repeat protein
MNQYTGQKVHSTFFTPDGNSVITSSMDGIKQWPLLFEDGIPTLAEPRDGILVTRTAWHRASISGDGAYVGAVNGGHAKIYPLHDSLPKLQMKHPQKELLFTTFLDGHRWLVGSDRWGQSTVIWDTATGETIRELGSFYGDVAASPDGKSLVTGASKELAFWDAGTWNKRVSLPLAEGSGAFIPVAVSPDSRTVAAALNRRSAYLLDIHTGQTNAELSSPGNAYINDLRFSPNGGLVAATTDDFEILIWRLDVLHRELAGMGLDW